MDQPEKTTRKRWRWLRFSLRSLLLFALFAGACGAVWWTWEPWPLKKLEHPFRVNEAKFSNDGRWLLTWGKDGLLIWNTHNALEELRLGQKGEIENAVWSPNADRFATALDDKTVRIWDRASGQCQKVLKTDPLYSVYRPQFTSDGTRMITSIYVKHDGFGIWDIENEKCLAQLDDSYHFEGFSKDGKLALFAIWVPNFYMERDEEREKKIGNGFELWSMESGTCLWHVQLTEHDSIPTIRFSEDEKRVLANYEWWGDIKVPNDDNPDAEELRTIEYLTEWDVKTGSNVSKKKIREESGVHGGFRLPGNWSSTESPDKSRKVTYEPDRHLAVKDGKTDEILAWLPEFYARATSRLAEFSPDGTQIVAANYRFESTVYLWTRVRPERWWGIAWLPAFWAAVVLFLAMLWSLRRDRRALNAQVG